MHHRLNYFLLLVLLSASLSTLAQPGTPSSGHSRIDRHALEAPEEASQSVETLAAYLASASSRPREKYRAIYIWMAHHITYDEEVDQASLIATRQFTESQQPEAVLQQRKAVCQGYAQLAKALADAMGLQAEVVSGLVRNQQGEVERMGHAWIALRVGAEWLLSDPTWGATPGAGEVSQDNEDYFLVAPEAFIAEHLPLDPIWQLSPNPLTYQEFAALPREELGPRFNRRARKPFVFQDSIRQHLRLDTLAQPVQAVERILRYNDGHPTVLFKVGQVTYVYALAVASALENTLTSSYNEGLRPVDEASFGRQMAAFDQYCRIAADCFEKVLDAELKAALEMRQPDFTAEVLRAYLQGLFQVQYTRRPASELGKKQLEEIERAGTRAIGFFDQTLASIAHAPAGHELSALGCPLRAQQMSLHFNLALAAQHALEALQGQPQAIEEIRAIAHRGLNRLYAARQLVESLAAEPCRMGADEVASESGKHHRLSLHLWMLLYSYELSWAQTRLMMDEGLDEQNIHAIEAEVEGLMAKIRDLHNDTRRHLAAAAAAPFVAILGLLEAQALYFLGIASNRRCRLLAHERAALEKQARQGLVYFQRAAQLAEQQGSAGSKSLLEAAQVQIKQMEGLIEKLGQ